MRNRDNPFREYKNEDNKRYKTRAKQGRKQKRANKRDYE